MPRCAGDELRSDAASLDRTGRYVRPVSICEAVFQSRSAIRVIEWMYASSVCGLMYLRRIVSAPDRAVAVPSRLCQRMCLIRKSSVFLTQPNQARGVVCALLLTSA